jgi:tRNA-specific 2-thiouridylase
MMNSLGINKLPKDTRVVVAMSGGVDSSVVAAMMKEQGYEVVGITLQLYDHGAALAKKGACCAGQDIHDARKVAERIDIPHYVLNYESKFKEAVMEDFVETYLSGQTPIPCVKCNQSVKFRDLLNMARELNADVLATGHYVQRIESEHGVELRRAVDPGKDQSYFLFATTRAQLDFLRFPLGGLHKDETRALALKYNLPVAAKPDSQDICFVPDGDYAKVIAKMRPDACKPGEIIHIDGRILGAHEGIIHYTVGQRRGLGLAHEEPLYVIKLDAKERRVIVGPKEALMTKTFLLRDLNWLADETLLASTIETQVKLRSAQMPVDAEIRSLGQGQAEVTLFNPREAVAPGQACVMYQGERVLGGGWINPV